MNIKPQQQLRNPYCQRAMRFTKDGYEALLDIQQRLEIKLERPLSESVTLNMILLGDTLI